MESRYNGFWHSENGGMLIVALAVVLVFLTLIGGIVAYHAFDRLYLDSYQLGVEGVLDGDWVQYHIDTDGLECDVDFDGGMNSIDLFCKAPGISD